MWTEPINKLKTVKFVFQVLKLASESLVKSLVDLKNLI